MNDAQVTVLIAVSVTLFAAYNAIVYIFSNFSYRIWGDRLKMQWRVLRYLPIAFFSTRLDNIREVRRGQPFEASGFTHVWFGPVSLSRGVITPDEEEIPTMGSRHTPLRKPEGS